MAPAGWLILFLVFLGAELAYRSLTSLWFAGGALGAWIAAWMGFGLERQLLVFAGSSLGILLLIRPLAFLLGAGRRRAQRRAGRRVRHLDSV